MTLDECERILRHWRSHPPAHRSAAFIASGFGWKPITDEDEELGDPNTSFPPEFTVVSGPRMPPPVFDLEQLRGMNEDAARRIAAKDEAERIAGGR